MGLIWSGLGVTDLVAQGSLSDVRTALRNLNEVVALANLLTTKLQSDPHALMKSHADIAAAQQAALTAAAEMLNNGLSEGTFNGQSSTQRVTPLGLFGEDATVTPSEADDISVYERGDTGHLTIENDTQLYLSVKVTDGDGQVLRKHITGLSGMAGPQGLGLLFWASTQELDVPGGKNVTVEVVTAGIDQEIPQFTTGPLDVWKKLYIRTWIERVIWPVLGEFLPLPASDFSDIVYNHAPSLVDIVVTKALNGDASGSIKELIRLVITDVTTVPPGPITQAIAKRIGRDFAERLLAKIAAKIGARLVPGVGQIAMAVDVAGHVNNGANAVKAVSDVIGTDSVIHFDVKFPLQIDRVEPSILKPNGQTRVFVLEGSGFSPILRGIWPFNSTLKPKVKFTDADGNTTSTTGYAINSSGTGMSVRVPGWFIEEDVNGPIDVSVHHPTDTSDAVNTKDDAITIIGEIQLSSIDPSVGGPGVTATLRGAGFSQVLSDNEVTVGSKSALVSRASDTALTIVIPTDLDIGTYDVRARARTDGTWGDWSNTIQYEVRLGNVSITVCDNGGLKDDAFALYVDGLYQGTMYANSSDYCDIYHPNLVLGQHTALLVGVEAPDSVGTYSISFEGVSDNISGSSLSGGDLTPGVRKNYTFEVDDTASGSAVDPAQLEPAPYKALQYDPESGQMR